MTCRAHPADPDARPTPRRQHKIHCCRCDSPVRNRPFHAAGGSSKYRCGRHVFQLAEHQIVMARYHRTSCIRRETVEEPAISSRCRPRHRRPESGPAQPSAAVPGVLVLYPFTADRGEKQRLVAAMCAAGIENSMISWGPDQTGSSRATWITADPPKDAAVPSFCLVMQMGQAGSVGIQDESVIWFWVSWMR